MQGRRCVLAVAASVVLVLAAGCGGSGSSGAPDPHAEGEGDLSMRLGEGGNSLEAPTTGSWQATFGSAILCTESGDPLTIESVEHARTVETESLTSLIRRVPPADERSGDDDWSPIGALVGAPPDLARPPLRAGGRISADVEGFVVTERCGSPGPEKPFTELLTVLEVSERGAWIDGMTVTYRRGDERSALRSEWAYVACGTAIRDPDVCEQ